jgi:hypothetical protein
MNLVNDINEITADQLTLSYVTQLKLTLKAQHDECLFLNKTNSKLSQKIVELEERLKLIESQRDFEILKSNLILTCQHTHHHPSSSSSPSSSSLTQEEIITTSTTIPGSTSNTSSSSNPHEIVRVVTSWFPSHMKISIACCIKAEDSWIIVEQQPQPCHRIPFSSLLDDVVMCCALSDDGFSSTELIPESILLTLGWSPLHQSVAVTVYSGCVWVLIGINFHDLRSLIPGFNSLLSIATELIITRVMNLLQETESSHHLTRVEIALEMWRLLLQPFSTLSQAQSLSQSQMIWSPPLTGRRKRKEKHHHHHLDQTHSQQQQHPHEEGSSTAQFVETTPPSSPGRQSNQLELELISRPNSVMPGLEVLPIRRFDSSEALCEQIFSQISRTLAGAIEGMECDLILFGHQLNPTTGDDDKNSSSNNNDRHSWIISSTRGVFDAPPPPPPPRRPVSTEQNPEIKKYRSLTEKTIAHRTEFYLSQLHDTSNNSSLHSWIDCGCDLLHRHEPVSDSSSHSHSLIPSSPTLAISPLWKDSYHHHVHDSENTLLLSGALLFRIHDRPFTDSEAHLLRCICRDNLAIIRQWLVGNLEMVLKSQIPVQLGGSASEIVKSGSDGKRGVSEKEVEEQMKNFVDQIHSLVGELQNSSLTRSSANEEEAKGEGEGATIQGTSADEKFHWRTKEALDSLMAVSLQSFSSLLAAESASSSDSSWQVQETAIYLSPSRSQSSSSSLKSKNLPVLVRVTPPASPSKHEEQTPALLPSHWSSPESMSPPWKHQNLRLLSSIESHIHSIDFTILEMTVYDSLRTSAPDSATPAPSPLGVILFRFDHRPHTHLLPVHMLWTQLNSFVFLTQSTLLNEKRFMSEVMTPQQELTQQLSSLSLELFSESMTRLHHTLSSATSSSTSISHIDALNKVRGRSRISSSTGHGKSQNFFSWSDRKTHFPEGHSSQADLRELVTEWKEFKSLLEKVRSSPLLSSDRSLMNSPVESGTS